MVHDYGESQETGLRIRDYQVATQVAGICTGVAN